MAMETVNAIREAETLAEQKILQAQEKALQIVADAEKHAEKLLSDCKKKCFENIRAAELEEERKSSEKMQISVKEAENEASALKNSVSERMEQATVFLLDEMFSERFKA